MLNSINTNASAMVALQNLNAIEAELAQTQTIIATGRKINSPKDNGAVWSIAQTMQGHHRRGVGVDAVQHDTSNSRTFTGHSSRS